MTKVTVSGEGSAKGKPDIAIIQIKVESEHKDQLACRQLSNNSCETVITILKSVVKENDIHAVPARVFPIHKDGMLGSKIVGYESVNTITASVRSLESVQQLVQQINSLDPSSIQVSSLQFDIENKHVLEDEARRAAFANARRRAETYGEEIGMVINRVKTIDENLRYNSTARHPTGKFSAALQEADFYIPVKETLETGDVELTIDVTVSFKLGKEVSNCSTN